MGKKAHLAVLIVAAVTLIVTVVRIVLTPQLQDTHTGQFHLSYVVIGLMAVTAVAAVVLTYLDKSPALPAMEGRPLQVTAWMLIALGAVLVITSMYDTFAWLRYGVTPPPSGAITGTADRLSLIGTLVCGLLAGAYSIRQGWSWVSGGCFTPGEYRLLPLALPLWLWMRLARYVVSYASAVSVTETFYDYTMLIVSLLFAMSLSRYLSSMTDYRSPALFWQALLTVLCGVSGPIVRFVMYLMGETEAYRASELASFPDLVLAGFAACVAISLLFGKRYADLIAQADDMPTPESQSLIEELAPEIPSSEDAEN